MAGTANNLDLTSMHVDFDRKADIFYFRLSTAANWVAEDVGDFFVLRDAETKVVVGFLVEDFERVFLKKHPELDSAWREARAPWRRWSNSIQRGLNLALAGFFGPRTDPQLPMLLPGG